MGKFRSMAAIGALALTASLSGCWWQAGAGPGKGGFNASETTVTAANVAGLSPAWTIDVGGVPREPLVNSGTTYVRTPDAVTARRLSDGGQVWSTAVPGTTMPVVLENALRVPAGGASCTVTTLALNDGSNQGSRGYGFYGIFVPSPTFSACSTADPVAVGTKVVTTAASFIQTMAPHCGIVAASSDGVSFLDYAATPQNAETGQNYVGPCGGGAPPSPVPPEAPTAVGDFIIRPQAAAGDARAYPVGCTPSCPVAWVVDTPAAWIGPVVALPNGDFAVAAADNTVIVVDGTTHAVDWTGAAGAPLAQPVAADDTSIYALTTDGHLAAFPVGGCGTTSCDPTWTATLTAPATARASIGVDVVYVGSTDGTVTALAAHGCGAATCDALWTDTVGAAVSAPPVISDGTLLVGAMNLTLTAFTL